MVHLTKQLQERVRDEVRQSPLIEGEIRRLVGCGDLHIALASTEVLEGYDAFCALVIDDINHQLWRKISAMSMN
jgi:hypothetical protein